jgi:thiosulfate/3-mercaptopyruvate sulfurtransferase
MSEYAHPEALVSTEWVALHADDADVRLIEVDVDFSLYQEGHIPGAVGWNWATDLNDGIKRDIVDKDSFEALLSKAGVSNTTAVILYGDANNWFAAWAFWQFKIYGHDDVRLMNGGRKKWESEGRAYTTDVPQYARTEYKVSAVDPSIRAFRDHVADRLGAVNLIDVRSPDEFSGRVIAPPGFNETARVGGHIPGAVNIPWAMAVGEDGLFKPADALKDLYLGAGLNPERETIVYCRIGERSSHTWFVLAYLLGFDNVRNYDGSWTEWGNIVGAPVGRSF